MTMQPSAPSAPAALAGLDVTVPGFFQSDGYDEVLAWLRAHDPVHRLADGTWLVTRYDDIRSVSRQPEAFASRYGAIINDPRRVTGPDDDGGSIIHLDPPIHAEHRSLLNRRFTPRAVGRMEEAVRAATHAVLDGLAPGDEVDLVDAVACPIPVAVIADLIGVDAADRARFRRWSDALIEIPDHPDDAELMALGAELFVYLDAVVRDRAAQPRDDLISVLVGAEVGGAPLTRAQLVMFCMTLLVAGNETTRSLISGGLRALAEHPDQRARLAAGESDLATTVEECLRWVTPIQAMVRTAMADVELRGRTIPSGAVVVLLYHSGNRDEAAFGPTAHRFDIDRPPSPTHVAFGFGEHLCLGAALARLEARIVFQELLRRFPNYELLDGATLTPSTLTRNLATLPARLR